MRINHLFKRTIILSIIFFIIIGFTMPSLSALSSVTYNAEDGFWTDTFSDNENITLTNCIWDEDGEYIRLEKEVGGRTYNLTSGDHIATKFTTFHRLLVYFFNPTTHLPTESPFSAVSLAKMKFDDGKTADKASDTLKRYVVHHFRFKLNVDADSVNDLHISWKGKAENARKVELLYWRYFSEEKRLGFWFSGKTETPSSEMMWLNYTLNHDNGDAAQALVDEKYIDIYVVASPEGSSCTLSTDYVEVFSEDEEGYKLGQGTVSMNSYIDPKNISNVDEFYWDILTWDDFEKQEATATYQLYHQTGVEPSDEELVPDTYFLSGKNSEGFTDSPVYLNNIPYDKLKLKATIKTTNTRFTPKIFSWTITWQTTPNQWQDRFYSNYRIDVKNKINHSTSEGSLAIKSLAGEWSFVNQNPQNTRVSDGKGSKNNNLHWLNYTNAEGELLDFVIKDEFLFFTYRGSTTLYKCDITEEHDAFYEIDAIDLDLAIDEGIYAPPAITDEFIIVVSGDASSSGERNYVYAFSNDEDPVQQWKFDFEDDISYWTAPIVVNDKVYVSTWSGDTTQPYSNDNNKLLALDLENGNKLWEFDLPEGSYATPAATNEVVVVACNEDSGNNLFAVDAETGEVLWNNSVGVIGRSSPVIYGNNVFIVCEKPSGMLYATSDMVSLDLTTGNILWNETLSTALISSRELSEVTPAIYNDKIYVASPDGDLYTLTIGNGTKQLLAHVYDFTVLKPELATSVAYADGLIYISTPDGYLYRVDASSGDVKSPFASIEDADWSFITSPITSNGLTFVGDEQGKIYAIGDYIESEDTFSGYVISIPIQLPEKYWWKKFYAEFERNQSADLVFSILDEQKNSLRTIENGSDIIAEDISIGRTIRLRADFSKDNTTSIDPRLFTWYVTYEKDEIAPQFVASTFLPDPDGWLNEISPECSIDVWDNQTGFSLSSAAYTIYYALVNDSTVYKKMTSVNTTGKDGTNFTHLTAEISKLSFYENMSQLYNISFMIYDLANNSASYYVQFKQDILLPISSINNETNGKEFSNSILRINATAYDPGDVSVNKSGLKTIELKYRYSTSGTFSGNWKSFEITNKTASPHFNFTAISGGGYYELITVATDNADNAEEEKESGDVMFVLDPFAPEKPDYLQGTTYWFNDTPSFSFEFEDDFRLGRIEYRPNFETTWTDIATNINTQSYDSTWKLEEDYWEEMEEDETYYLFFRITDSVGNVKTITDASNALKIRKDDSNPSVNLEIPELDVEWSFDDTFTITAFANDGDGSGVEKVELFYRYSNDGKSWSNWKQYGDSLTSEPFKWEFNAKEGDGYYEFRIAAQDGAGNFAQSQVFSTGINIFPLVMLLGMIGLIILLIVIVAAVLVKWKKK